MTPTRRARTTAALVGCATLVVFPSALEVNGLPRPPRFRADRSIASADGISLAERLDRFRAAVRTGSYVERMHAFDGLDGDVDLRTLDAVLWVAGVLGKEESALAARIAKDEAGDLDAVNDLERAGRAYERLPSAGAVAYERYQRERARLESLRRTLAASLGDARVTISRLDRLLDRTQDALTRVLTRLPDDAIAPALDRARAAWLHGPGAGLTEKTRFLNAVSWVRRKGVEEAISSLVDDPLEDVRVRGAALRLRADRRGDGVFQQAVALLAAPSWILEAAAVEALRILHDRASIEPLIAFLGRTDLGRLREDARRALCSLTGEAHGPYRESWEAWWADAKREFEMPKKPVTAALPGGADAGASFYGISTFSQHVLFVVDVSASMTELDRAVRGGSSKIDVARRELVAALGSLDSGGTFGVLLFNGAVTSFSAAVVRTDESSKARARAFVASVPPAGPTNMIGALEEALRVSGATGDTLLASPVDTIFFLTDGRPSAGPVVDPGAILEVVARRRLAVPVVIHAIGIGEHDPEFLRRLAESTGGRYVSR